MICPVWPDPVLVLFRGARGACGAAGRWRPEGPFRSSPTSASRAAACHPQDRSAAEDPRSGLTRRGSWRSRRTSVQPAASAGVSSSVPRPPASYLASRRGPWNTDRVPSACSCTRTLTLDIVAPMTDRQLQLPAPDNSRSCPAPPYAPPSSTGCRPDRCPGAARTRYPPSRAATPKRRVHRQGQNDSCQIPVRIRHVRDPLVRQLPRQTPLHRPEEALRAAPRLRRVRRDHLDPELPHRPPKLRRVGRGPPCPPAVGVCQ